ncbi:MAG TPA: DUF1622 domain-containing protein [Longimicrobium sp.]|jgi:uncharacterized membrane protein
MIQGSFEVAEGAVEQAVQWLRLGVEAIGALIVALGVVLAVAGFVRAIAQRRHPAHAVTGYTGVRLTLARYLGLALEFQLASDILSTAIAPSWTAIGKLAAIAVIRTVLNYFLSKEMEVEARELEPQRKADESARQAPRQA